MSNKYFLELYDNQLETIPKKYRIFHNDILRLSLSTSGDIFGDECTFLYNTNNEPHKHSPRIFYFSQALNIATKKLLYYNYVNSKPSRCIIKTPCYPGCITIKHFVITNDKPIFQLDPIRRLRVEKVIQKAVH